MHRGYVKLWRKTIDTSFFRNASLMLFWMYCLLKASHSECTVMVGFQEVHLSPGQFVFGRDKAAAETGLSPRQIRTCVLHHTKLGNLTIKTTNKFSIITVLNWELYQTEDDKTTSKTTSRRPANDQQTTTNKNDKNGEEEKIKRRRSAQKRAPASDDEWLQSLKDNPAYTGLDVDRCYHRMRAWCDTNGKEPTRRRFVNWLNREERPLRANGEGKQDEGNIAKWLRMKKQQEKDNANDVGQF